MDLIVDEKDDLSPECPICLAILIRPITLYCGHNFCYDCLSHPNFSQTMPVCPICRKRIVPAVTKHKVNKLLEESIMKMYYKEMHTRLEYIHENHAKYRHIKNHSLMRRYTKITMKFVKNFYNIATKVVPLITLIIAIILLIKFRKRFRLEYEYNTISNEISKIMASMKKKSKK